MSKAIQQKNHSILTIKEQKKTGKKISALTAYDYTMAKLIDTAGIDIILVGDSAANVICGYSTTLPITLEHMIYHAKCVSRGVKKALIILDMPFLSYQISVQQAVENCGRAMKQGHVQGVKIEGAGKQLKTIEKLTEIGIPVMGHLGLTPQSVHQLGGYKLQAIKDEEIETIIQNSKQLENAGCFSIVLEKIPSQVAKTITSNISIPTIGIGAGPYCDGQILVLYDMIGLNKDFKPKFLRHYADVANSISNAVSQYIKDIQNGEFPTEKESY